MAKEIKTSYITEPRTDFGKGASRRIRREGKIPAVLYSKGNETLHFAIESHELNLAIRNNPAQPLTLEIDGASVAVVIKAIARDPLSRELDHVDFVHA